MFVQELLWGFDDFAQICFHSIYYNIDILQLLFRFWELQIFQGQNVIMLYQSHNFYFSKSPFHQCSMVKSFSIFFIATFSPVRSSFADTTTPYAPFPKIFLILYRLSILIVKLDSSVVIALTALGPSVYVTEYYYPLSASIYIQLYYILYYVTQIRQSKESEFRLETLNNYTIAYPLFQHILNNQLYISLQPNFQL